MTARAPRDVIPGSVGGAIRAHRTQSRIGTRDLARRISRPPSIVSRWETGQREPTIVDLAAVARALAIDPDGLLAATIVPAAGRNWSSRAAGPSLRAAIGRQLRSCRSAAALAVAEAARQTGIPTRRLVAIEAGRDATAFELALLRRVIGFTSLEVVRLARLDSRAFWHVIEESTTAAKPGNRSEVSVKGHFETWFWEHRAA